jgi:hypothetical protein
MNRNVAVSATGVNAARGAAAQFKVSSALRQSWFERIKVEI